MDIQLKRTCRMKHFCERESFMRKREYQNSPGREYRYEVWDTHCAEDPEWDDPTTTEQKVFETDDKSLAEAFIAQGAQRCEIRENGICKVCDMYDRRQTDLKAGVVKPFYIVVEGIRKHYGGPEEGGWWYDWHEVLEVRKAFTLEQGLFHARKLREQYPQPKYDRHSCANRGEQDIHMVLCYGESDPRWPQESTERPRYE